VTALGLFDAVGVELEYMVVDAGTLDVRAIADTLLGDEAHGYENEIDRGAFAWSNELALHVVEVKTTDPVTSLAGVAAGFDAEVRAIEMRLAPHGARLLGTAMHPWMDPHADLRLWPHGSDEVYAAFHRIFDCRGHGWANLQSVHVNLPFDGDDEFARLHAAIRLVLPILPALAASSPLADGKATGLADTRLEVYRHNADRVPSVAGRVVPEAVATRADYESRVLQRIYDELAPLDPEGVLRHEWVNARGAIARFDRQAIEIRVPDVQECPQADLAVVAAVVAAVRALVEERWAPYAAQREWAPDPLAAILCETARGGDRAEIHDRGYLNALSFPDGGSAQAGVLWQHLIETTAAGAGDPGAEAWYRLYARHGCLARRITGALGPDAERPRVAAVYGQLAECLRAATPFTPA
jgi:gamma-glutamyl:cysteine ligase YbdK (ATP-grasp superfamily)